MRLFSNQELQILWNLFAQVSEDAKECNFFIQENFPKLFNEEGALPLEEAIALIKEEVKDEYQKEIELTESLGQKNESEDAEEILYLRYLQRDLLKPKGDYLLTLKKAVGIIVIGFLFYLALRGRFF